MVRLLVVAVALIAAFGIGFAVATASADQGDPADEMRRMHAQMHARHGGTGMGHDPAEVDRMHAEMSSRLSPEDRAVHERMHEACSGLMSERSQR
ncbi:MAG TPA: hypothetical protein VG455_07515 [Acidimicrobiales bacterium]|nr:hypothetical protein [Acidimicrobiales bacterium]